MPACFREQMRACINNSLHNPCLCLGSQQPWNIHAQLRREGLDVSMLRAIVWRLWKTRP